jgi:hypothetical protein
MLQLDHGSPRSTEARARANSAARTSDFVHYVVHFAASREGVRCEMCDYKGDVQHAPELEGLPSER